MFSPSTPLDVFFHQCHVPECLPGAAHAAARAEYEVQLRKFRRFFHAHLAAAGQPPREVLLSDLSDELLKLAMHWWLERGNEASTANKLYRHVKATWNLAWGRDLVPRQCRTRPYREVRREPRAWLAEEVTAIVRASFLMPRFVGLVPASDWWPALVLASLSLGTRITATMAIETRHLDLERGEVLVLAESQKHRSDQPFDLLPSAVEALRRIDPARQMRYVFGDWPFDPDRGWRVLRKHLRKLLVLAGLFEKPQDVTRQDLFHKFRRCVATEIAAKQGIDAARLYLGHSSTQVTERYIDKRRLVRPKAVDVLTDPLPPGQYRIWREGA